MDEVHGWFLQPSIWTLIILVDFCEMWEQVIRASPLELSISRLRLAVFFFGNPTNKTGTAYMWVLLIANHLDQSLWSNNQKYWAAVRYNLLHSFLEVHNCVASFTSYGKLHEFGAEKPIPWAKTSTFWLSRNKFYCLESHSEHRWRCSWWVYVNSLH